jgi:choice-of-anchor B domain-containing protein
MKKITLLLAAVLGLSMTSEAQDVNITFRSNLQYPGQTCANIWGYVDSLGNEYALVGASLGLSIVDVTDPDNPFEVAQIPGPNNLWKEVKTWDKYAYVVSEGGNGVQIVDLSNLPGTNIPYTFWQPTINSQTLDKVHALHIDNGKIYLYGGDLAPGGCIIADLSNPWNPTYLGRYDQSYIHDGYVRNDTLYGGHIYNGFFSIMDLSNPSAPVVLQTQVTPGNFTHNTWLSDDSKTLFTTDEVSDSYLTAYDISDISNISELDRIQATPGSGSVVHNTHILNDWAVTSWYRDGVTIVDGHRPQNLVQVANYDTYPGTGNGFDGSWGVYPFLPSGNLVVSNIDEGLFVLSPVYVRACYLEGNVIDSICGTPLTGVTITITTTGITDVTDLSGNYRTGYHTPGTYTVTFSKPGYNTKTITGVNLTASVVTNLNVQLFSPTALGFGGNVSAAATPMQGVNVILTNSNNTYNFTTDANGDFSSCNVVAGTYTMIAGAWGYQTTCSTQNIAPGNTNVTIQLTPRYYDDFSLDYGWTVTGNASSGQWERGIPQGTDYNGTGDANPGVDVTGDCSTMAFVTGNAGGSASADDVDNGMTVLTSPVFDLSAYDEPHLFYSRWFFNDGGTGNPNDSLVISITNGTNTAVLETVTASTPNNSSWKAKNYKISSYVAPTANMQLIVKTADAPFGHLVEAGLDHFFIADSISSGIGIEEALLGGSIEAFPNPFTGNADVKYDLDAAMQDAQLVITDIAGREVMRIALAASEGVVKAGNDLSGGVYFIHIASGTSRTAAIKLVKLK